MVVEVQIKQLLGERIQSENKSSSPTQCEYRMASSPTGQIRLSLSQKSVQWAQSWTRRRGIGKTRVCEYQYAKLALALSGEKTRPHSRMGNDGESS